MNTPCEQFVGVQAHEKGLTNFGPADGNRPARVAERLPAADLADSITSSQSMTTFRARRNECRQELARRRV
jgi:hypothetical protein